MLPAECGSSRDCAVHLCELGKVYETTTKLICDAARKVWLELGGDDDEGDDDNNNNASEKSAPVPLRAYDVAHQVERHTLVDMPQPCADHGTPPTPVAPIESEHDLLQKRISGVGLTEANLKAAHRLLFDKNKNEEATKENDEEERDDAAEQEEEEREQMQIDAENALADRVVRRSREALMAEYTRLRAQQKTTGTTRKQVLLEWFAFATSADTDPSAGTESAKADELELLTSLNATETLRAMRNINSSRGVDLFQSHTQSAKVGLNVERAREETGAVDLIKLLRSRQVPMSAKDLSVSALKRRMHRWIERARCDKCLECRHRCAECAQRKFLSAGVVLACAGTGACGCAKGVPVTRDQLKDVWASSTGSWCGARSGARQRTARSTSATEIAMQRAHSC